MRTELLDPHRQQPRRGLLLALLAVSGLLAPIASSIGTERSQRTLGTLLAAAVTPLEIVLGKWLAWAGFATFSTGLFATMALAVKTYWYKLKSFFRQDRQEQPVAAEEQSPEAEKTAKS